jgi:hypothetical protein
MPLKRKARTNLSSPNIPLKIRGIKGGYDRCKVFTRNPPDPSYPKRGVSNSNILLKLRGIKGVMRKGAT